MPVPHDGDRRQVSADPRTIQENPREEQRNEGQAAETEPRPTPRIQLDNQRPSTSQQGLLYAASSSENRRTRAHRDARRWRMYWDNDDFLFFENEMRSSAEWYEIHKRSMIRLKELYEKMLDEEEGEIDR